MGCVAKIHIKIDTGMGRIGFLYGYGEKSDSKSIEDILKIDLCNNNVTIFMSNTLKIERFYKSKDLPLLETRTIKMKANHDLVISGLGFIKFTKDEVITVSVLKNVNVYMRNSLV